MCNLLSEWSQNIVVGNEQDVFMNYGYIFNDIFTTQMTAVYQKQEAGKHTM